MIVLSVPDHDRVIALYAFLLLVGAVALGGLVVLLAGMPAVPEGPLVVAAAPGEHRPEDLEALERELREAFDSGAVDARLRARTIASARLARVHGIDMAGQPDAAAALLRGTVVGRLLADAPGPRASCGSPGSAAARRRRVERCSVMAVGRARPGSRPPRPTRHGGRSMELLSLDAVSERAAEVLTEVERAVIGKRRALELVLIGCSPTVTC